MEPLTFLGIEFQGCVCYLFIFHLFFVTNNKRKGYWMALGNSFTGNEQPQLPSSLKDSSILELFITSHKPWMFISFLGYSGFRKYSENTYGYDYITIGFCPQLFYLLLQTHQNARNKDLTTNNKSKFNYICS